MKTVVIKIIGALLAAGSFAAHAQVPPPIVPATTNPPAASSFFGKSTNFNRFPRTNVAPAINTAIPVPAPTTAGPAGVPAFNAAGQPIPPRPAGGGTAPLVGGAGAGANTNAPFVATNIVQRGVTNEIGAKTIDLREADITQILELYSILTGKTLLRSPQVPLTAKITVRNETALTRQEGIDALNTILGLNGIAMVPEGDKFIKVIPEGGVPQAATPFSTNATSEIRESQAIIAQIVTLKNLTPEDANSILSPYAKLPNSIVGVRGSPVLVLRDYSENVKRMLEILEKVDIAMPSEIETVVIPIKYALAGEIASVLTGLGASSSSGLSGGGASGLGGGGGSGFNGSGGLGGVGGAGGFNRSGIGGVGGGYNSGINQGINSGGQYGGNRTGVGAFGSTGTAGGASPGGFGSRTQFGNRLNNAVRNSVGAAGGGAAGDIQLIGQAKIIPDERSNALLVFADHRDLITISNIIAKLDVVLPQVLIEALIMEVNLGNGKSLGVSMSQNHQKAGDLDVAGVSPNGPSFLDPRTLTSLGSFGSNAITGGGLKYFGRLNDDFDVAVTAAANDSRINVLSRPRIQTSTAKPAHIFVGETRPYVTGTYFSGLSSGSQSQVSQTQIGITLDVVPIVNQEGLVTMDIQQHISQVGGTVPIDGNDVPITIERDANGYVSVNNRDTILLGGFISTTKNVGKSGVPYLKDIPGLGVLFRSSTESIQRVELMVMIRPTVLPNPEAAALTAAEQLDKSPNIKRARREEDKFQGDLLKKEQKEQEKAERKGN